MFLNLIYLTWLSCITNNSFSLPDCSSCLCTCCHCSSSSWFLWVSGVLCLQSPSFRKFRGVLWIQRGQVQLPVGCLRWELWEPLWSPGGPWWWWHPGILLCAAPWRPPAEGHIPCWWWQWLCSQCGVWRRGFIPISRVRLIRICWGLQTKILCPRIFWRIWKINLVKIIISVSKYLLQYL